MLDLRVRIHPDTDRSREAVAHAHAADHYANMAEFARWETATGGPDPQFDMLGWMCKDSSPQERFWRAGCYIGPYNVPTAEVLWLGWSHERILREGKTGLLPWITEHWPGLAFRRERRAVRTRQKLTTYLLAYADWCKDLEQRSWMNPAHLDAPSRYEEAWIDCQRVPYLGRYVALNLLEFLTRHAGAPIFLPDIRAAGAWSPRTALCLLEPDEATVLLAGDSRGVLSLVEHVAARAKERLRTQHDMPLSWYDFQTVLCEYRESYVSRRQFPGRSLDSELKYAHAVHAYWQQDSAIWPARAAQFPHVSLGEISGWESVREELGTCLRDHGYTWSDLVYDYHASKANLATPITRT